MADPFEVLRTAREKGIRPATERTPFFNISGEVPQAQAQAAAQQIIAQKVAGMQTQGVPPQQIMRTLIASPEFADVIGTLPADQIFDFVSKTVNSVGAQPPSITAAAPGSTILTTDKNTNKVTTSQAPTANIQEVQAIAEARKRGDNTTADLLQARFLGKGKNGQTGIMDALRLKVAAPDHKTGNDLVDALNPKQANMALNAGKGDGAGSLPTNLLIVRALGQDTPGNALAQSMTPAAATAALQLRKDVGGVDNIWAGLMQMMGSRNKDGSVDFSQIGKSNIKGTVERLRNEIKATKGHATSQGKYSGYTDDQLRQLAMDVTSGKKVLTPQDHEALAAELDKREAAAKANAPR